MQDFFLGGALQMVHHQHPAPPGTIKAKCLSYHGFETKSTGSVTVRLNVVVQHSGKTSHSITRLGPSDDPVLMKKETQDEIDEREIEEMELRQRLVKRAQDRVNKYAMLEANSIKKGSTSKRRQSRSKVVRQSEPAHIEQQASDPTSKNPMPPSSLPNVNASGPARRPPQPRRRISRLGSTRQAPPPPPPVAEKIESNMLATAVASDLSPVPEDTDNSPAPAAAAPEAPGELEDLTAASEDAQ
eukprot:TRINITY_DN36591_c0_g1_i1.p1 TRINITY_DN36591_c0_g1~~TRINITY_DN36591_c0_g1_i1.p1  ORF type:complete len:243 (-),score=28.44 TRINITY_DN36591_c0_g1_i1:2-730(-)